MMEKWERAKLSNPFFSERVFYLFIYLFLCVHINNHIHLKNDMIYELDTEDITCEDIMLL